MNYKCYGLTISSEIPLPELFIEQNNVDKLTPDVRIIVGELPKNGLPSGKQFGPRLWAEEQALWLNIPGVARFLISEGREIHIDPEIGADENSIRLYLLGSAFGAILLQRGLLVLHGNAVRVGDGCMVCVGDSGAGKSTLAAAFMQRGHQILADDVVPIDAQCYALPGFPRIKLWQNTAEMLNIDTCGLRRIRPDMQKFNFPTLNHFADQPLPVKWIYVLSRNPQAKTLLEPIQGMSRFHALHKNTYRAGFLKALSLKSEHMKLCVQLAGHVRIANLIRPEQGFTVNELVDRILDDIYENS